MTPNELHFAVVIGINCYPGIPNQLTTARGDAEEFAAWLRDPDQGGLSPGNVRLITATPEEEKRFKTYTGARPIRHEVLTALAEFHEAVRLTPDRDWPRTRLYIYAAAHGLVPAEGRGAVIFADASPQAGFWSEHFDFYQCDLMYERFTPFSEVVMLSDCCREIRNGLPPATRLPFDGPRRGPTRRLQGYASEYSQPAGANVNATHLEARGFFTAALLEGLKGAAPCDPYTGTVDSTQLAAYVKDRVPTLAADSHYEQAADFTPAAEPILLSKVSVRAYSVTAEMPSSWLGSIAILSGDFPPKIIDSRYAIEGRSTFLVPNGIYYLVADPRSDNGKISGPFESEPFRVDEGRPTGAIKLSPTS